VKTAISIPDPIFEAAEKLARRLGMSRSQFYSAAVDALVEEYRSCGVTERLNAVHDANLEDEKLEPELDEMQSRSPVSNGW
jgi:metal-responsive CopG/Arc/MetJ family transcriptional regulator